MNVTRLLGTTETEEELMGRVAEGDVRAFEAVYDRYSRQAYSLARHITGVAAGAEEATQDAFLSLWRGASRFDPERARLVTWLLALVRYRSIDWLRRARRSCSAPCLHRGRRRKDRGAGAHGGAGSCERGVRPGTPPRGRAPAGAARGHRPRVLRGLLPYGDCREGRHPPWDRQGPGTPRAAQAAPRSGVRGGPRACRLTHPRHDV